VLIEHDRAVHLSGEAYTGNVIREQASILDRLRNRQTTGPPPVFGMLLGPSNFGRGERFMLFSCGRDYAALFIEDESARSAGANIDAKYVNGWPPANKSDKEERYCRISWTGR
jgi:hypothetical protein